MRTADGSIRLLTVDEVKREHGTLEGHRIFEDILDTGRYCSAGAFGGCIMGMLVIPDKNNLPADLLRCGFYMDDSRLLLVCDDKRLTDVMNVITAGMDPDTTEMGAVFFELVEHLIMDDMEFLEQYEKQLAILEECMTDEFQDIPADFDRSISANRRDMRKLMGYYKLMGEVVHVVDEYLFRMEKHRSRQLFSYLGSRISRLCSDVERISAYAMQIRDVHTSKVSMRQNQVMQTLTIVTAIFMPLTLIAGWYGMNFAFMPELTYRYGYLLAAVLAAVVVLVEIIIFKKKKWF